MKQLLGWLLLLAWCFIGNAVNIKLVDPPHTNRYYSSSSTTKILTLRAPPANVSGPPHLQLLSGKCFKLKEKRYTYLVCPFHNVTQNEDSSVWNSFHGVLGVWREWLIEEDVFVGMHFTLGEPCGRNDREVKIMFKCSTITRLTNVTEPSTCKYTIWMHTPLACFKGAMQIYHVLKPAEIDKWDDLNQEYHGGDLTKKGLDKRRRQLLLGAGLYYNFTKDQEYLNKQYSNPVNSFSTNADNVAVKTELDHCQMRVKSFEKQLENAKSQMQVILTMIGEKDPLLKGDIEEYLAQLELPARNSTNHTNTEFKETSKNKTELSERKEEDQELVSEKKEEDQEFVREKKEEDQEFVRERKEEDQELVRERKEEDQELVSEKKEEDQEFVSEKKEEDQEFVSEKKEEDQEFVDQHPVGSENPNLKETQFDQTNNNENDFRATRSDQRVATNQRQARTNES